MQMHAMGYTEIPSDILITHTISKNTLYDIVLGAKIPTNSICM